MQLSTQKPRPIIRRKAAIQDSGLSDTTFYRLEQRSDFPRKVYFGRACGLYLDEWEAFKQKLQGGAA